MSEKRPAGRPTGRPQGKVDGSAEVHKRGEGLNTGKVGNVNYNERKGSSAPASGHGTNRDIPNNPLGGIGGLGNMGSTGSSHGYSQGPLGNTGSSHGSSQNPLGGIGGLGSGTNLTGGSNLNPNYRPKRSGGRLIRIIFFIIIVLFVMRMLGMCGTSSYYQDNQTLYTSETPKPTANTSSNTTSATGSWHPVSTTYENADTEALDTAVASGARDKFTTLKGNGNDTVTMLVYMCGTDLESSYGMATSDLNEML